MGLEICHARQARSRRAAPAAALAAALILALAAAASAHHGQPPTGESETGETGERTSVGGTSLSTDTELTPVAKDGSTAGWEQVAGSRWRSDGDITQLTAGSPTPYDLDLYGVAFLKAEIAERSGVEPEFVQEAAKSNGFAVGAQCRRSDPAQPVAPDQVTGCERIPVIYRYREKDGELVWEESYRGSDANAPGGFVSAVAWLSPDRALAVGGTGTYPRRERELSAARARICEGEAEEAERKALEENPQGVVGQEGGNLADTGRRVKRTAYEAALEACADRERGADDVEHGAGMARAWLFESGTWREITSTLPAQMRALHALDVSPRPTQDCSPEVGETVEQECALAGGMRQLWYFADGKLANGYGPGLDGVTPMTNDVRFRFRVRDVRFAPGPLRELTTFSGTHSPFWAITSGCCSLEKANDSPATIGVVWFGADGGHRQLSVSGGSTGFSGAFNPDSFYSGYVSRGGSPNPGPNVDVRVSYLVTPGGPSSRYEDSREPPSRFAQSFFGGGDASARDRTLRPDSTSREARYYDIPDTEVITHRYALLLSDPDEPWRACDASDSGCQALYAKLAAGPRSLGSARDDMGGASGASNARGSGLASQHGGAAGSATAAMQELTPSESCEPYLCLPERVAKLDPITGELRAGGGKYPNTFALATLSVGDHVATQPLLFTRSPSFIVNPALGSPAIPSAPTGTGTASAPPPPPGAPVPKVPSVNTPAPPPVPPVAPLQATEPPEPQPPAPPVPPPPSEAPAPISLTLAPPSIAIATPTAVIQPPTPPVNPAPPGGARREARQRQAAAQKSGADNEEGQTDVDMAGSKDTVPGSHGMTRHDHAFTRGSGLAFAHRAVGAGQHRGGGARMQDLTPSARHDHAFTAIQRADDNTMGPALLYTGGITLLAAALALGRQGARPTPRHRPPEVPAPARAWTTRQRR